ncbi:GntP family permease [Robertkochia aurantiaca]|uniref:GntP family permease n=1 Tax=Robertkochia aurantiaca TaxID=2873700 RepID=UPI001CCEBEB4|nr:gluconate:H+ symporter [Robertkochia sp. 3YJGBD-33]
MFNMTLLLAVLAGIAILLILILLFRIHAFLSLLISSIATGILAGMTPEDIIETVETGMGGTLGFVATVVGLGAIFGAILEQSGGAQVIAEHLLKKAGVKRAPLAMTITGFLIAIPVFFEVAFILIVPMIYALQKRTGRSLLLFAIPLLAGLAVTHAFIPPTPGPIAVAEIIGADLGAVILIGFLAGIPTVLVSGILFGKYIGKKIFLPVPFSEYEEHEQSDKVKKAPSFRQVLSLIAIPIVLILLNTLLNTDVTGLQGTRLAEVFSLLGHPFTALIIANIIAWYVLGIKKGFSKKELLDMSGKSLAPAGMIILITGAGGVFKQVLVNTGAGNMIAQALSDIGFPLLLFAFIMAALIRVIQGSATVAMITAAGIVSPLLQSSGDMSALTLGCVVIAIASGASIFSHLNDSGFWLVSQYLGMNEKQTFRSWTLMTTILAFTGLASVSLIQFFL